MNISAITNYKNNYNPSFQKLIVDNPNDIDGEKLFEIMRASEILKMQKNDDIHLKADGEYFYLYKQGMDYKDGFSVSWQNTNELISSLSSLKASEALKKINKVLANQESKREDERFFKDKVFEKMENINRFRQKFELKNTQKISSKNIYGLLKSEKLKNICDDADIIIDFGDHSRKIPQGKDGHCVKVSLLKDPDCFNYYLFPKDLSKFDESDITFV